MRSSRKLLIGLVALFSTAAVLGGSPATAAPATQAAQTTHVASVAQVTSLATTVTTLTKSCNTGGYSYMTDNFSATRHAVAGGSIAYDWSRSGNRMVPANINGTTHYVYHTATSLVQFSTGSSFKKTSPPTSGTVYSQYGTDDLMITFHVYDNATMDVYKSCTISF